METIRTIKGFDHELKCRGFQYEVGKTYTAEGKIKVCSKGFHAIRNDVNPLSVYQYYAPVSSGKPSRYCIVECSGEMEFDDNKLCCSHITIIEEISIDKLHELSQAWVLSHSNKTDRGGDCSSLSGGYCSSLRGGNRSSLSGGYCSSLSGGNCSSLRGGDWSSLSGGNCSSLSGGNCSSLRAGDGSSLIGGNCSSLRGGYGSSLSGGYGSSLRGGYGSSLSGGDWSSLRGGSRSSLRGGDCSSLRGGNCSSLRAGNCSSLRGGNCSSLRAGDGSKFCGGKWSTFFVEIRDNGYITDIATVIVDDVKIKENQWYKFDAKVGEWAECDAPDNAIN